MGKLNRVDTVMLCAVSFLCATLLPLPALSQSLEWLAEHPGSTTPALMSSSTPLASTTDFTLAATTSAQAATAPSIIASDIKTNEGIEAKVRAQFADAPIMADIARCESRFRQFNPAGNPLHGGLGGAMVGIFQIYETIHASFAQFLGMDIYTTEGNIAYARYLYNKSKTDPWISSMSCWSPLPASESEGADTSVILTSNLSFGMVHPEVLLLQKLLNKTGALIATEGSGSPGQETTKFGSLTRAAVRNFQCRALIVCEGDEYSTGYGFVGPRTRKALLAATPVQVSESPPVAADQTAVNPQAEIVRLEALIAELSAQLFALKQKQAGN